MCNLPVYYFFAFHPPVNSVSQDWDIFICCWQKPLELKTDHIYCHNLISVTSISVEFFEQLKLIFIFYWMARLCWFEWQNMVSLIFWHPLPIHNLIQLKKNVVFLCCCSDIFSLRYASLKIFNFSFSWMYVFIFSILQYLKLLKIFEQKRVVFNYFLLKFLSTGSLENGVLFFWKKI